MDEYLKESEDISESEVECPFCGEPITLVIDASAGSQSYIEDCSVCCRPIQVSIECSSGRLDRVDVTRS